MLGLSGIQVACFLSLHDAKAAAEYATGFWSANPVGAREIPRLDWSPTLVGQKRCRVLKLATYRI